MAQQTQRLIRLLGCLVGIALCFKKFFKYILKTAPGSVGARGVTSRFKCVSKEKIFPGREMYQAAIAT